MKKTNPSTEVKLRTERMADATCGMNGQAYVLLQALAQSSIDIPENVWIRTMPFTNCREMGFVIQVLVAGARDPMNLCFFEHRNSDSLCCLKWEGTTPIDGGVRSNDIPAEVFPNKWTHTKTWGYMEILPALQWVTEQIQEYCKDAAA